MNVISNKWIGQRTIRPDGADKVTGRAAYSADTTMPGLIWGKVLRSPHAHARIKSIDTSKAEALPGVKAVVTAKDLVDFPLDKSVMLGIQDMRWMCRNVMAREKALFHGHPVAAVAATSEEIAAEACKLIEVDYEVLPHVIDVEEAMKPDAPILHDFVQFEGKPSNIAGKLEHKLGDVDAGFAGADVVVERSFSTEPVHQGYIEPHACLVSVSGDGKATIFSSSQGQFMVRAMTSLLTGIPQSDIRAIPAEIGGGFGGKTIIYLEPVALLLAKKSGRPVKMMMSREEVFRASGPTSGSNSTVKIGATKDGKIVAAQGTFYLQAGALPGLADPRRGRLRLRPLRHPERPFARLRRRLQPLQGRRLSRPGRADRRLCGRMRAGRAGRGAEDGPAGAAAEERREAGDQGRAWPGLPAHRLRRDARGGARRMTTTRRRSASSRAAAWPAASGSTPAARAAPR